MIHTNKTLALILIGTIYSAFIGFISCGTAWAESNQKSDLIIAKSEITKSSNQDQKHEGKRFSGNVSWYGVPFNGKKTSSGRIFDMNKLTAAHRSLPFGTKVLVENPRTGQSVIVEVIDRGPFVRSRVMDLSREAAHRLGTLLGGIAYVNCLVIPKTEETSHENNQKDNSNNSDLTSK